MGDKPEAFFQRLETAISESRESLLHHRLYRRLETLEQLRTFMELHVFAVWDFMSLLKALQTRLTCVRTPWLPEGNPQIRRLMNEIVLGEESDTLPEGGATSHFELYLRAMVEVGAKTGTIDSFLVQLRAGKSVPAALTLSGAPSAVQDFVRHTFAVIEKGDPHEIAAAFTYGREDLIPEMFTQLVHGLERQFPGKLTTLRYYLDRHIELDGKEHGNMGRQMVYRLCEQEPRREREVTQAAIAALHARIKLWDGIASAVEKSEKQPTTD